MPAVVGRFGGREEDEGQAERQQEEQQQSHDVPCAHIAGTDTPRG
ncbi:hypothetical protein GCM10010336_57560 [Streptomyces goshikiensis]|nr:hypothetical protein GCM10010336_57560 [Streptomyces goshikiensis]